MKQESNRQPVSKRTFPTRFQAVRTSKAESHIDEVVILACGRSFRRDDQAGLRVADLLRELGLSFLRIITSESPTPELIQSAENAGLLIIVDAARPTARLPSGSWQRIEHRKNGQPVQQLVANEEHAATEVSSHLIGLLASLQLANDLEILPANVWLYVIAADNVGYGPELTPEVERAVTAVANRIKVNIEEWRVAKVACHA